MMIKYKLKKHLLQRMYLKSKPYNEKFWCRKIERDKEIYKEGNENKKNLSFRLRYNKHVSNSANKR